MADFSSKPYDALADEFRSALAWLESLGIRYEGTRIGEYERALDILLRAFGVSDFATMRAEVVRVVTALFEINELIEIHRRLAGTYDVHLIRHVQTVSRGPINYVDENPATSSNAARNIAFELAVMAKLASVGIPLDFSIPIDVACDFGGRSLLFECKRPQSTEKVETNVRKAFAQLEEKYRTSQRYRHRGIIALDVTKLINPEFMLYSQADEVGLSEGLGHLVDDIVRTHERLWQRGRDPKTIGVMIRACVMGVNQARDHMLTYCQQWGLTAIGHVGAQSIGTVIALTNALRGTSENVV